MIQREDSRDNWRCSCVWQLNGVAYSILLDHSAMMPFHLWNGIPLLSRFSSSAKSVNFNASLTFHFSLTLDVQARSYFTLSNYLSLSLSVPFRCYSSRIFPFPQSSLVSSLTFVFRPKSLPLWFVTSLLFFPRGKITRFITCTKIRRGRDEAEGRNGTNEVWRATLHRFNCDESSRGRRHALERVDAQRTPAANSAFNIETAPALEISYRGVTRKLMI